MIRRDGLVSGWACALLGAVLACAPTLASADVLEIGAGGATWVAGGPQALAEKADLALPQNSGSAEAALPVPGAVAGANPLAYTQPLESAGPDFWRGYIASIAKKYDISPALLEAVIWQESRWKTNLTSPAGAYGLAQLMPGTARYLGVDIRNPYANIEGGARYLRMQLDRFGGDVEKALAAYNAGPGRVIDAGGVPNIAETKAYVAAIMARLANPVRR